ncbi:hypothetical protein HY570_02055 [Candidatus Micrarchaeota archaeon]|nr:hypothetical protein [Candidatus Micrarchaeota archaeon]
MPQSQSLKIPTTPKNLEDIRAIVNLVWSSLGEGNKFGYYDATINRTIDVMNRIKEAKGEPKFRHITEIVNDINALLTVARTTDDFARLRGLLKDLYTIFRYHLDNRGTERGKSDYRHFIVELERAVQLIRKLEQNPQEQQTTYTKPQAYKPKLKPKPSPVTPKTKPQRIILGLSGYPEVKTAIDEFRAGGPSFYATNQYSLEKKDQASLISYGRSRGVIVTFRDVGSNAIEAHFSRRR